MRYITCFVNIFLHPMACLFIPSVMSFEEQKFLILMKSKLLICLQTVLLFIYLFFGLCF